MKNKSVRLIALDAVRDLVAMEPSSCKRLFLWTPLGIGANLDEEQSCYLDPLAIISTLDVVSYITPGLYL